MTRRTFLAGAAAPALATASPLNWIATNIKGEVLSRNWPQCEDLVSTGSLLKPFLAISYLATHTQAPVIVCGGACEGCWFALGHGRQDLSAALANSCNVYFLRIATDVNRAALDVTSLSYGLVPAGRAWDAHRLIGLDEGWPQSPIAVAQAFAALSRNATDAGTQLILAAMARCARSGTAKGIGFSCHAKTGTAPCCHTPPASGDGYALAIYPVAQPRRVMLTMKHNTTGASAACGLKSLIAQTG